MYESSGRIVLIENDKMVMEDGKIELTLDTFFSNIVTSLNIPNLKTVIFCKKVFHSLP